MSSLSRTYARASNRGSGLMKQYQPPGAYQEGERRHREEKEKKRGRRQLAAPKRKDEV